MGRLVQLALVLGAVPLSIVAYRTQVHDLHSRSDWAAMVIVVAWSFLVAGVVAWSRRPDNRLGPLMAAAGLMFLLRQLRYSHEALLFTIFFAVGELPNALVGHSVLAYPSGRVTDRYERLLLKVGYATVLLVPFATLLVHDATHPLPPVFFDPLPRRSLISVVADAHLAELLQKGLIVGFYGVLSALFVLLIARRLVRASPRMRRILAPLLLGAVAIAIRAVFQCIFTFVDRPFAADYLFWWQVGAFVAVPLALLGGLLRARLARATVGDLVVELGHTEPAGLREALARALDDPTIEVAFWLPERQEFVDAAGRMVELPRADAGRAVTHLDHGGEPLAALIHDPSLLDEPKLVEAAGAAARLALENARLQAEQRAQLAEVQRSRARIVAAADEARRRIERDLHDGAQQRLVALAVQLRTQQMRLGAGADPEIDEILDAGVAELQAAVRDLRELAHGLHPTVLTEEGLAAALEALARRTPLTISLETDEGRFPAQVEAAAYFVACEALANVAKHAHATTVVVNAHRTNGTLVVEIADDGVGGARVHEGSGLRGLADRVEALGGTLRVESSTAHGTRIVGEIPCGP
jgi:signal transduction histidine kinase